MNVRAATSTPLAAGRLQPEITGGTGALAALVAVLLVLMVVWNNRNAVAGEFVGFDDDINIVFNPHLGPPSRDALQWMFTDTDYMRRYVPLGWLGFSLVYSEAGLSATGYHGATLALHALNALAVYVVVLVLLRRFSRELEDGWRVLAAALSAALWAFHPMKAETVGWASGLLYAASGFFGLMSVVVYLRGSGRSVGAGRMNVLWGTAACYACSVFTYPVGLGLLIVFALIDVAERQNAVAPIPWTRLAAEKMMLALPGVVSAVMSVLAGYTAPAFWPRPASFAEFGWMERVQQSVAAAWYYSWRPWWPSHLTPAPTRFFEISPSTAVLAIVVLGGATLTLALRAQWRRGLLFWVAHFALLGPVLGWTERPYFPADRYHYLASAAVAAAVAFALLAFRGRSRVWIVGSLALAVIILAVGQRLQLRVWHDMDALMARVVSAAEDVGFRQHSYWRWTTFYLHRGELAKAENVLAVAASREPTALALVTAHTAVADAKQHRNPVPVAAALHHQLARDFSRANRSVEANEHFRAALRLSADGQIAYNYATFLALDGRPDDALHLYLARMAGIPAAEITVDARRKLLELIAAAYGAAGDQARARRVATYAARTLSAVRSAEATPVGRSRKSGLP